MYPWYDFKELAAYGNSITDLHIRGGLMVGSRFHRRSGMNFEEFFSCFSKLILRA